MREQETVVGKAKNTSLPRERGDAMARIQEIRCIRTRANGSWVIVKVLTDQPGLYGVGSASDHYHSAAVIAAIEEGLGPRLIGREAGHIEDNWQSAFTSGYW